MTIKISPELLAGFSAEATELLVRIAANVEQVHLQPDMAGHLDEARRAAHQAKGAASMIGLSDLAHVFYFMEEALEELRSGRTPWTGGSAAIFGSCVIQVSDYIKALTRGELPEAILTAEVGSALELLRGSSVKAPGAVLRVSPPGSDQTRVLETTAAIPAELLDVFRMEAEEHLTRIGDYLNQLERQPDRQDFLLEVRRSVHTLKGASGSVGFAELSRLSHRMEDLLDRLADTGETPMAAQRSLLVSTYDVLCDMSAGSQNPGELQNRIATLYARYDDCDRDAAKAPAPKAPRREVMPNLSAELIDSFRQETEERLQSVQEQLRMLEANPSDADLTLAIRRTIHTVKGASAMIGHVAMSTLAHRMEDLLDALAAKTTAYDDDSKNLLYVAADVLTDLAATAGTSAPELSGSIEEIVAQFDLRLKDVTAARAESERQHVVSPLGAEPAIELTSGQAESAVPATAPSASGQYVRVPIERLDELVRFVSELLVNRSTFEQYLGAYGQEVRELDLSITRLKRISQRLDSDVDVTQLRSGIGQLAIRGVMMPEKKIDKREEFDLLEFDRYTDLHLVSRDLAETAVDVTSAAAELRSRAGDFDSYLNRLSRLTSDIQDRLMRLRMVPLASLSTRLHRTVRVTGERTGKQADFVLIGERVELDKTVLEEMAGPIEHALRNAVDHGIEGDALRWATGKPARGRISLEAHYEGTQVVLSISDDGSGINPDLVRAAAVERGLVSDAEAALMPADRVLDFIFRPGFSTARTVSEVSGRGVGMDVVKSTVTRLKGTVELTSVPGQGTRLTVRLPMTLAIMRVILVKAHGETYALPANMVTRILRVDPESIEAVAGKTILRTGGKVIPLLRLGESLQLKGAADKAVTRPPALLLQLGDQVVALLVDEVLDAREVVVKTLGTTLRKVRGFTGATLMGDGSVVLILNPGDLVEHHAPRMASVGMPAHAAAPHKPLEILTVDDSVSVRRVLAKLIEGVGWRPTPAKDGLEALELLQRGLRPDAILLDVEMPRMDGYELLGALRALPQFKQIPIVMLTSRAGEKHRKKAFEMGATDYLVKPYQEDTLLAVVRRVVREAKELAVR